MKVEQLTDPLTFHGEGPAYSPRWRGPRWVDMLAGDVLELTPDGTVSRHRAGSVAAFIRPRRGDGHVIADARRILLSDDDALDAPIRALPEIWGDESIRMNEGGCDPAGNAYAGSVAYDHRVGIAKLYVLHPDLTLGVALDAVTVSNGIDWSPDSAVAYYIDSHTRRIDAFSWDPVGGLRERRPFVSFDDIDGDPDGLTVDAEGGVWVAMFGASQVRRYSAAGTLDFILEVPVSRVTAMAFAGPRLDELIITTSRKGLDIPVETSAGALFGAHPGVRGLPIRDFAG